MKLMFKPKRPGYEHQALRFMGHTRHHKLHPNPRAAFASVCLHAGAVIFLTLNSTFSFSDPIHYQVKIGRVDSKAILWYFPKDRLPEVASNQDPRAGTPKVQLKRPGQVITADVPKPQPGKQLIWQPSPQISLNHEEPLPNLLAFIKRSVPAKPLRDFIPPDRPKPPVAPPVLPEATPLPVTAAALSVPTTISAPAKPPLREFAPPPMKLGTAAPTVVLEMAPNLLAQEETYQPVLSVVGLDPARTHEISLPEGVRAPRFSAGPEDGPGGQRLAAILVPGLNVQGKGTDSLAVTAPAHKTPQAYHEPSAQEWAKNTSGKDSRRMARSMMSAALRPGARIIAPSVEAYFPNRALYTTSFEVGPEGSMEWVIWFAEQGPAGGQYVTIRPPVPWYRDAEGTEFVLPSGQIKVVAVIDKNGRLNFITTAKGTDPTAGETASKLIAEWVFLPALRNGEPITVDALIDVRLRSKL
jgi:hypothetical protein